MDLTLGLSSYIRPLIYSGLQYPATTPESEL